MTAPATGRRRALAKALTALLPMAPFSDIEAIRADAAASHMKTLPPNPSFEQIQAERAKQQAQQDAIRQQR